MRSADELLAAYVDGVTELTTEERRRVEELLAQDPALRTDEAKTREVIEHGGFRPRAATAARRCRCCPAPRHPAPRGVWRANG